MILDIRNPVRPKVLVVVEDTNFAFWHSATISNDGKKVLFTDELGGGGQPTCNPTVGPRKGADAIYDITDPGQPAVPELLQDPADADQPGELRGPQREPDPEQEGP